MAEYKLTVHKDSEHETGDDSLNKVQATIVVSFKNPKWEAPRTEKQDVTEPELHEDGSAKIDPATGAIVTKVVNKEVTIESDEPETLEFTQEIFVPMSESAQKRVATSYADQYEKDYLAAQE